MIYDTRFNQDSQCFILSTDTGFHVFNSTPFAATKSRIFKSGIRFSEMLFRTNIVAFVRNNQLNKVIIWDDAHLKTVGELSFKSDILNVKMIRDRIVVVLEMQIYIYWLKDLKLMKHIETLSNPKGLCAISTNGIFVCPALQKGFIFVGNEKAVLIQVSNSDIGCLALNFDGTLLATASEKGTLIRVYNSTFQTKLHELRRGLDKATIISLCFSKTSEWLICSSDKSTIHLFSLTGNNTRSTFNFLAPILPSYFNSQWSISQIPLSCTAISFTENDRIIAIGTDENFYSIQFDKNTLSIIEIHKIYYANGLAI